MSTYLRHRNAIATAAAPPRSSSPTQTDTDRMRRGGDGARGDDLLGKRAYSLRLVSPSQIQIGE